MNLLFKLLFIGSLVIGLEAQSAPIPMTSSSKILGAERGLFHSPLGFFIHAEGAQWTQMLPPKNHPNIQTQYRSNRAYKGIYAGLTLRVDHLVEPTNLTKYIKKWLKDYPKFGFQILAAKKVRVKDQIGFLVDLLNVNQQKQLRQVVFIKRQTAVILTCRNHQKMFSKSLAGCNQLIRNLEWYF